MRPRALGDDDEIHDHQNGEDDDADNEVTAHHEIAECFDDMAGRIRPSCPCDKISRVEARLRESRNMVAINSTVGNAENSSGAWMNSDVIRISTEM